MSVFICSLNSGSNGNSYYVGDHRDAVLVDAGLSCRETEKRLKKAGLDIENIRAVFVSHEHGDHISGLPVLVRKYRLPVYISEKTLAASKLDLDTGLVRHFKAHEQVAIGDLQITPFPKFHDAEDPFSFVISRQGVNIGVFTDIGRTCEQLVYYFRQCHAAFLEANYDRKMLAEGSYPRHLKNRISGGSGHLSNHEALELVQQHRPAFMRHLQLAHLSENNNDPGLVQQLFRSHSGVPEILVASRFEAGPVWTISAESPIPFRPWTLPVKPEQLSLF